MDRIDTCVDDTHDGRRTTPRHVPSIRRIDLFHAWHQSSHKLGIVGRSRLSLDQLIETVG